MLAKSTRGELGKNSFADPSVHRSNGDSKSLLPLLPHRRGLGYAKVASFFHRDWDQVFRCSVLEVSLQGSVVGPFSGLMRKAILKQAKTERPSDTVQLRHTGFTMGSGVL